MGLRDSLNHMAPSTRIVIVILAVGAVGLAAYLGFRNGSDPAPPITTISGDTVALRCTACGETQSRNRQDLLAKGQIDPLEGLVVSGEAKVCPKCGKDTMAVQIAAPP